MSSAAIAATFARFVRPATVAWCVLGTPTHTLSQIALPLLRGGYRIVAMLPGEERQSGTLGSSVVISKTPPDVGAARCIELAVAATRTDPCRVTLFVDHAATESSPAWPWGFSQREFLDCAAEAGLRTVLFNSSSPGQNPSSPNSLILPASFSWFDAAAALVTGVLQPTHSAGTATTSQLAPTFGFGPHVIPAEQVFATSQHCFVLTNLKPVTAGHVLVVSRRSVARFRDLTPEEVSDLWLTVQAVSSRLESHLRADSVTIALQDGAAAGQTVPHLHVHILPRHIDDLEDNDAIYDMVSV